MKKIFRASEFARYALCPASHTACLGLAELEESVDAAKGKEIHAIVEYAYCNGDQVVHHDEAQHMLNMLMIEDVPGDVVKGEIEYTKEYDNYVISGHIDIAVFDDANKTATIIDLKTGHSDQVPAEANAQLRVYAWLLLQNSSVYDTVNCVLISPHKTTRAVVLREHMADITNELSAIVSECLARNVEYNPGQHQCQWCKASGTPRCHASLGLLRKFSDDTALDIANLPRLLDLALAAKKVIDKLLSDAKKLLEENPDSLPGFELKPGRIDKTILLGDALAVLNDDIVAEIYATETISLSKIKAAAKTCGINKEEMKSIFNELLAEQVICKQCASVLKQIKV